jgi:hypothetical protein
MKIPENGLRKVVIPRANPKRNKRPHVMYWDRDLTWWYTSAKLGIYREGHTNQYYLFEPCNDLFDSKVIFISEVRRFETLTDIRKGLSKRSGFNGVKIISGPFPSFKSALLAYRLLPDS